MATAKLFIRRARAADLPEVELICAQVWGGDDYVPEVWPEWLADPQGQLSVATLRGRVVGLAKLSRHGAGEWWLQGIRVDPKHRDRGVGRQLHDYHVGLARQAGPGRVRFTTGAQNLIMQHIAADSGFRLIGRYTRMSAAALPRGERSPAPPLVPFQRADLPDLERFLRESAALRANHCLYSPGWVFYELTPERLAEQVAARGALGWRGRGGAVSALVLVTRRADTRRLHIDFADARSGTEPVLVKLALALRELTRRRRLRQAFAEVKLRSRPEWRRALAAAGFADEWEPGEGIMLYERSLP